MKKLSLFITLVALPGIIFAQTSGKVAGTVLSEDGQPLPGANVIIVGTTFGAASDENGNYYILDVPIGTFAIRAQYIGYKSLTISNVYVSSNLTTNLDFHLTVAAVEGETVEIVAQRPLINENATNTTRIIEQEVIQNNPLRGVESLVALQTGAVAHGNDIFVRGSRRGDITYYVDGVNTVNPWSLMNSSTISNNALEEIQFQSGGFNAEFGNTNGGIVNTVTRSGSDKFSAGAEVITGLGSADPSDDQDALYSYGYNLFNFNLGGPLGDNLRFFGSFERQTMDDFRPTNAHFSSVALTEEVNDTTGLTSAAELIVQGDTDSTFDVYNNYNRLYGPKPNSNSELNIFTGNVLLDLKPLRIKVGGSFNTGESRGYVAKDLTAQRISQGDATVSRGDYQYTYLLLNDNNTPKSESKTLSIYSNFTFTLSPQSFVKLNASYFNYFREFGDHRHMDNISAYGDTSVAGNEALIGPGKNPTQISQFANYTAAGAVFDDYIKSDMSSIGLRGDYFNQVGKHELKAGFEYRSHTLRDYRINQPMELAEGYDKAEKNNRGRDGIDGTADDLNPGDVGYIDVTDVDWLYTLYRNAYAMNNGYTQQGEESDSYDFETAATPPGEPVVLGVYLQDKIELDDLILNIGVRLDRFDFNVEAPEDYDSLFTNRGRIDRDASGYSDVDPYTYISPRIGFSFPVTDKTVFHAQYGTFVQHPILDRLYVSDSRLAANLTQGNMTESPNASLKPERTTQYEIGFAQQIGDFAAIDMTGYYKEVRDYTMLWNRTESTVDGASFSWSQFINGDYGVVKGVSTSLSMRRVHGILVDVNYTLQWANGTGSDPSSNFMIAWTGQYYPAAINPLEYDQRHTGSVMVDYRSDTKVAGLFGLGMNTIYTFGSGTAYTPSVVESAVFGRGWYEPQAAINSGYRPWTTNLDIRADFTDIAGTGLSAYLLILNVFNTQNVRDVYPATGEAGSDGWLETPEGQVWIAGNPVGEKYYEDRLAEPNRFGAPKMVRLGLTYSL